jgi:hypothetical protein
MDPKNHFAVLSMLAKQEEVYKMHRVILLHYMAKVICEAQYTD